MGESIFLYTYGAAHISMVFVCLCVSVNEGGGACLHDIWESWKSMPGVVINHAALYFGGQDLQTTTKLGRLPAQQASRIQLCSLPSTAAPGTHRSFLWVLVIQP